MANYREEIVDIELESGTIHRTWLNHSIGLGDAMANRFGVRLFRGGEPEDVTGEIQGFMMRPGQSNLQIYGSGYTGVNGNVAWIVLPQAAYSVEGQFSLAIKLIGGGVTGTMRIIDGMVDNTGSGSTVAPTAEVPSSAEIIAAYEEAAEVIADFAERGIASVAQTKNYLGIS